MRKKIALKHCNEAPEVLVCESMFNVYPKLVFNENPKQTIQRSEQTGKQNQKHNDSKTSNQIEQAMFVLLANKENVMQMVDM